MWPQVKGKEMIENQSTNFVTGTFGQESTYNSLPKRSKELLLRRLILNLNGIATNFGGYDTFQKDSSPGSL